MSNMILESNLTGKEYKDAFTKSMERVSIVDMITYQDKAREITGSDIMPAVLYKGSIIPIGQLGSRSFAKGY